MEKEIILPGAIYRSLIVFLISLSILSLGSYSTGADTAKAPVAITEAETELTTE